MRSFFRYPGGKGKIIDNILPHLKVYETMDLEYREPFFGGGSVGLNVIDKRFANKIWINDKDIGVACLWTCVMSYPKELKKMVMDFQPSIKSFDKYKEDLLIKPDLESEESVIQHGFKKLAIHQISYSGLGTKSGGPLGGRDQRSKYKIDCRWSPSYICKKINIWNEKLKNVKIRKKRCTSCDFEKIIKRKGDCVIYLDPPYYEKGADLYQCSFNESDHVRLSNVLKECTNPWILSYDDCEEIRKLYSWAVIQELNVNYSITSLKNKETDERIATKKTELLICTNKHIDLFNEKEKRFSRTIWDL